MQELDHEVSSEKQGPVSKERIAGGCTIAVSGRGNDGDGRGLPLATPEDRE